MERQTSSHGKEAGTAWRVKEVWAVKSELLNEKDRERQTYSKCFRIDAVLDQADAERELLTVEVCILEEVWSVHIIL